MDKDDVVPEPYQLAPLEEVFELHRQDQAAQKKNDKGKKKMLASLGFEGEHSGEAIL